MKVDWKKIWDANPQIFVASGWEQCTEEKRKAYYLPSSFSYFSAGNMQLRVGIIATEGPYKDEDFIFGGIRLANRLSNGVPTVIYFVAQEFSPIFLGAIAMFGGALTAKAVYWRERLTPSLYLVQENAYYKRTYQVNFGDLRPDWQYWEKQLNPVAWNHLKTVRNYFERLAKRRVRISFEKNKISYSWGNLEIAEVKRKGNKFELTTKVKWTRNKNMATKFSKTGWVDLSGTINDEFCRAINGILELLENMEASGSLDLKEQLVMKLLYDREFIPHFLGTYYEFPWLSKGRHVRLDVSQFFSFRKGDQLSVVCAILEKPVQKVVDALLMYMTLSYSVLCEKVMLGDADVHWNNKIILLCRPELMNELRLCKSWLINPDDYPLFMLPEDWETEGFKSLNGRLLAKEEDLFV